jgi:putative Mn2+ efflux pump MntP
VAAAGAYALCGAASTPVLAALALAFEAVAVAVGNVANLTLRQRITPNELLGRVGNVMRFFIFGTMPLGALAGGFLVQWLGVRAPFAGAAMLQLCAVVIVAPALVRRLRPTVQPSAA